MKLVQDIPGILDVTIQLSVICCDIYNWPRSMAHRIPSNGSGFSDTGSMERPKTAGSVIGVAGTGQATGTATSSSDTNTSTSSTGTVDKRKKLEERIDARQVIDDLIKSVNLENDVNAGKNMTEHFLACHT